MEKRVNVIISALVIMTVFQVLLVPTTEAQETRDTKLYFYGNDIDQRFLLTDEPTSSIPHELNVGPTTGVLLAWIMGTFETVPLERDVNIEGSFLASIWVEQIGIPPGRVELSASFLIDDVETGIQFNSELISISGEELITFGGHLDLIVEAGQIFQIEIVVHYSGTNLNVYWGSSNYPSHVVVPANWCSIVANDPVVNEGAETVTINGEVEHALGTNEIINYQLDIDGPRTATSISGPTESISNNVITVSWIWDWGNDNVDEDGLYSVTITAIDNCGNHWSDETAFYISINEPEPPPPPIILDNWNTVDKIVDSSRTEEFPSLIQDAEGIYWLAYEIDDGYPEYANIYIKKSSDGIHWESEVKIFGNNTDEIHPCLIQDSNGKYWMVWSGYWSGNKLWVSNSDDGISWSTPVAAVTGYGEHTYPSMIQDSDGTYWIAWRHRDYTTYPYEYDILLTSSTDGVNWDNTPTEITDDDDYDTQPSLIQDSTGTYRIAWSSNRHGSYDIYLSYSTDPEISWETPYQMTDGNDWDFAPSLIENVDGGFNISWNSDKTGRPEIWFAGSPDWNTWSDLEQVTEDDNPDSAKQNPSLIQDNHETLWIAWRDYNYASHYDIWISNKSTNDPPTITIVNPDGEQRGNISFQYTLKDSGSDICSIRPMYSTNNIDYYDAALGSGGDGIIDLSSSPSGITHTFVWDSSHNVTGIEVSNVLFKILPNDCQEGGPGITSAFSLDNNGEPVVEIEPISDFQTGSISFSYTVADNETDRVTIIPQYSLDGETYSYASMGEGSDKINNIKSSVEGKSCVFVWNSKEDLPDSDNPEVFFRITAKDSEEGIPKTIDAFHLDNKSPLITSGPTIISKTHISATIQWETDEPSDGIVYYGLDRNYGNSEIGNTDSTSHSVTLNLLEPETEYHFYVSSSDYAGNEPTVSVDKAFTTNPIPNDPPVVLIISLKNGDTVSGEITIHGEASDPDDDGTLEFVEIKIDNDDWKKVDGKKAWKYKLDTKELENGKHDIYARAFDGRNYSQEFSLQIKVDNQDTFTYIWIAMILVGLFCIGALIIYAAKRGKTQRSNTVPSVDFYQQEPPRDFIPVAEPYTHDSSMIIAAEPVFTETQPFPPEEEIIY